MLNILPAKDGSMTLQKDGVYLLSAYKPALDAIKYLDSLKLDYSKHYFVVFGSALGYLTKALEEQGVSNEDIAVFEPEETLYRELIKKRSAYYLLNEKKDMAGILEEKIKRRKKPVLVALETFKKAYSEVFGSFQFHYSSEVRKAIENIKVSAYFSKVWFLNYYRNLTKAVGNQNTYSFSNQIMKTNFPVLVAAAGPSLNDALPEIRKFRENFVLISVLSASRTLIQSGIEPDFVVVSDAGAGNILHAAGLPAKIPVLASVYANSAMLAKLPNPVVFYDLFAEIKNPSFELKYPSVSIDAGLVARELFSGPIVFCGLDLSYSTTAGSHSAGNALSELRPSHYNRLNPIYSNLSGFLKRKDIFPLPESNDLLFSHPQFRMVHEMISSLFGSEFYYNRSEFLYFPMMKRLSSLKEIAVQSKRDLIQANVWNNFAQSKESYRQIFEILQKYSKKLDDVKDKIFIREMLSGLENGKTEVYYQTKIAGLYHNLSTVVP